MCLSFFYMLQGNSRFYVKILDPVTNGAHLCYIFPANGKPLELAFKFDDNGEVMIDKFSKDSESSFKFELSSAEEVLM